MPRVVTGAAATQWHCPGYVRNQINVATNSELEGPVLPWRLWLCVGHGMLRPWKWAFICDPSIAPVIIDSNTNYQKVNQNFLEWVVKDNSLTLDYILAISKTMFLGLTGNWLNLGLRGWGMIRVGLTLLLGAWYCHQALWRTVWDRLGGFGPSTSGQRARKGWRNSTLLRECESGKEHFGARSRI